MKPKTEARAARARPVQNSFGVEDDAGSLFREWLKNIREDFRQGHHVSDPRRHLQQLREKDRKGRRKGAKTGRSKERGKKSSAAAFPPMTPTEEAASSALDLLGSSDPVGGGGPSGAEAEEMVTMKELIRTA